MLVIHEYELINIDTKLSKIINIPVNHLPSTQLVPGVMNERRIVFFIQEIEYSPYKVNGIINLTS
jgi:hypothetical protein